MTNIEHTFIDTYTTSINIEEVTVIGKFTFW